MRSLYVDIKDPTPWSTICHCVLFYLHAIHSLDHECIIYCVLDFLIFLWVIVFDLSYSSQKFVQSLATRNHIFEMDHFSDKSDVLGEH